MNTYSIGQIAKKANVSNRTLRYYEELGLIAPKNRGSNRYRYYDESHLQRLQTIKMLQESGFALKEVVAALSPMLDPSGHITHHGQEIAKRIYEALGVQKTRLTERQSEIAATVTELDRTMAHLKECFGCTVSSSLEDCARCERGPAEVKRLASSNSSSNDNISTPTASMAPMSAKAGSL